MDVQCGIMEALDSRKCKTNRDEFTETNDSRANNDFEEGKCLKAVRLHQCKLCMKVFPHRAHLKEHEVSHLDEHPYSCPKCHTKFKRKNAWKKHMRTIHPKSSDQVSCSCGKVFPSQESMEKHQECSGNVFLCPTCGVYYKTQASLDNHMLLHNGDHEKYNLHTWPFTCHLCGEKLSSKVSLNNHINQTHSMLNLSCHLCSKTFKTKQLLMVHLLRKHKVGDQTFTCPTCGKAFQISKDLRRHMQSHNPEGSHKCPVCLKKFKVYSTLQSHMKIHSKDKPYDCVICLSPSASLDALKNHMVSEHNIEVDEESFGEQWNRKCLICGQVFLRRSTLTSHIKTHLKERNLDSPATENSSFAKKSSLQTNITLLEENDNVSCMNSEKKTDQIVSNVDTVVNTKNIQKSDAQVKLDDVLEKTDVLSTTGGHSDLIHMSVPDTEREVDMLPNRDGESDVADIVSVAASSQKASQDSDRQLPSSLQDVKASASTEDEETKYICGQCSSVFIDMDDLKIHLLTCYQQEASDDFVVVFEVDESK